MISPAVCVLGISLLIAGENKTIDKDTRYWIASNICAAANDRGVDPRILGAYVLNENRKFDLWAIGPAVKGRDHGLFQTNSYFQRDRENLARAHHPYYGASIAASIIQDNLKTFGWSWKAFAAYWSQQQAKVATSAAQRYYQRFTKHYDIVSQKFIEADSLLRGAAPSNAISPSR